MKQSITPKCALLPAFPGLMNDTTTCQLKSKTLAATLLLISAHWITKSRLPHLFQIHPLSLTPQPLCLPMPTSSITYYYKRWSANLHPHPIFLSDARKTFGKHKSKHVIVPNKHFNGSHCHKVKLTAFEILKIWCLLSSPAPSSSPAPWIHYSDKTTALLPTPTFFPWLVYSSLDANLDATASGKPLYPTYICQVSAFCISIAPGASHIKQLIPA